MPSTPSSGPGWVEVRRAAPDEVSAVAAILTEAAAWAASLGDPLWQLDELAPERLAADAAAGLFVLAFVGGEPAGTLRFQLDDPEFWPDDPGAHACYVHRLAIRRRYAGGIVSAALLRWAVDRTAKLQRELLRLDCDADRPGLRAFYERFGFRYHSHRRVGPYFVARYQYPVFDFSGAGL